MSQATPFEFAIRDVPELSPVSLEGREAVSEPFAFSVIVRAPSDGAASFEAQVDREASLSFLSSGGARRTLTGVVRRVEIIERTADGALAVRYGFGPRFARLEERYWSRIHANLSVPAAIARVLAEHGVAHRFELSGEYPEREYQVQYQETDRAFVERIAAEVGLFYYFAGGSEGRDAMVVFADGNARLHAVDAPSELQVHVFEGSATTRPALREEQVASFQVAHAAAPKSLLGFDYDFKRPLHGVREQASPEPGGPTAAALVGVTELAVQPGTVYEHRSDTERPELTGVRAVAVLDQWKHGSQVASCLAGSRVLAPGYRFTLARHPVDGVSRGYVITSVKHTAYAEEAAGRSAYQADLTCVADAIVPRPARPPRRVVQVTESALVVGPHGHEIHTDEHGRVRIRFHWDTRGAVDLASCFVRVVQPWAGEGWGFQFIPRIGMEVLVTFLQGDPDVPVVVGALPNAAHPPPFALPGHKSKSGIKTRSTPHGEGHNELSFDDATGAERIFVRAERDFREEVQRDRESFVAHDDTREVGGETRTHVHGASSTTVDGRSTVRANDGLYAVIANGVGLKASGTAVVNLENDFAMHVRGSNSMTGDGPMRLAPHKAFRLTVSDEMHHGELDLMSEGHAIVSATSDILVQAGARISLRAGSSELTLEDGRITIQADAIDIRARKTLQASGKGPSLALGDTVEIVGKEVHILSESAELTLNQKADLRGTSIALGGPRPSEAKADSQNSNDTKQLDLTFQDRSGQPYEKATYVLRAGGERYQGKLDFNGRLRAKVPAIAETAEVTLWIDRYPEGRRKEYAFHIRDLAAPNTPRGAKERLKMLGYFRGTVDDRLDDDLRSALRHFKSDRDIEPADGTLSGPTAAELQTVFGH